MIKNKITKSKWFNRGFTLIELLVVVSIIGMLSSVVLVSVQGARTKARDAKLILEVKELQKALELYRLDNNTYAYPADGYFHSSNANCPVAIGNQRPDGSRPLLTDAGFFDANFTAKYMPKFPTELVNCGIHYLGIRPGDLNATPMTCNDGTSDFDPDGYGPGNVVTGDRYYYIFVVTLLGSYNGSPSMPKSNLVANSYCFLGPKR